MLGGHDPHIHKKRLAHVPSYNFHSYPFTNSRYKGWASLVAQEATEGQTVQPTLSTLFLRDSFQYYPPNYT